MTRYLIQPRDQIFAKGYGFLYFYGLLTIWVQIFVKI